MAHFSRIRNPGSWLLGESIVQAEFQAFDDAQFASVNGDAGGNWTPSNTTSIGGAGVDFRGQTAFSLGLNTFTWTTSGSAVVSLAAGSANTGQGTWSLGADGALAWNGSVTFASGAACTWLAGAPVTFSTNTNLVWNGNVTGTATIPATAAWKLLGGATLTQQAGSGVTVSGGSFTAQAGSTVSMAATVAFASAANTAIIQSGRVVLSGSAAQTAWRVTNAADANGNYDCSYDIYAVPALTANRTYTILHTSGVMPVEGTRMRFHWYAAASVTLTLIRENGSTIAKFVSSPTADNAAAELIFRDSAWHCIGWCATPFAGGFPAGG